MNSIICSTICSKIPNQHLEAILEQTLAGYWDWHITKNYEYYSPTFKSMLGYKEDELENDPSVWQRLIHPEDLSKTIDNYHSHVKSKGEVPYHNEVRYYHKDGSIIWILCKGNVVEWSEEGEALRMVGCHINISDIKQKESILKSQQTSANLVISGTQAGIWERDCITNKETWSEKLYDIFGYKPDQIESNYHSFTNLVHPGDRTILHKSLDDHFKEHKPYHVEIRIKHKSGRYIWVESSGQACWDKDNKPTRMAGSITNIDNQKRLTEQLNQYKTLFDLSEDPMCMCDTHGKVIKYNKAFDNVVGYNNTLSQSPFSEIIFKNNNYKEEYLENIKTGKPFSFESIHFRDKKNKKQYKWSVTKDNSTGYTYYVAKDVTTLKEKKDALRRAKEILQDSQKAAQLGHWEIDIIENNLFWSDITRVIHEVEPDFVPTIDKGINFYDEASRKPIHEAVKNSIEHGTPFDLKLGINTAKGKHKWVRVKGRPICENDSVIKISGIFQDITEDMEKEFMLIEARKTAEEAAMAKEDFLATMSHEIRTPLNSVIGMSHLLIDENPRKDQVAKLKTLKFSAEHLLTLINDILDYSKIESGQLELEKTDFNLLDVVEGVHSVMSFKAKEKNIKLKRLVDQQIPPMLQGDPIRFVQILNNLVSNAIKFTNTGCVKVILELEEETENEVQVLVTVKDTGIGISEENISKIFNRFTQAESNTTRRFGGTGLGLSITKNLLELFNSKIEVESTMGKGSEFFFYITFKKSKSKQNTFLKENENGQLHLSNKTSSKERDLEGIKILLAEDNPTNQMVASQFLNKWNVDLEIVSDGKKVIQAIDAGKSYDIILMDLQMPEMDGIEATKMIKQKYPAFFDKVQIIALSAANLSSVNDKIRRVGMVDFIPKPFNPDELYDKLRKQIVKKEQVVISDKQGENELILDTDKYQYISFKKIQELMNLGKDFMHEYLNMSKKQIKEFKRLGNKAILEHDENLFGQQSHKTKSNFHQLGAFSLLETIEEIKSTDIIKNEGKEVKPTLKDFNNKIENLLKEVDGLISATK